MCMEDVRIGRKTQSQITPITVGVTSVQVIAGSPDRVALILGPPLTGTLTYSVNPGVVAGQGLNVTLGSSVWTLDIQTHGDVVRMPWYAIGSGAGLLAAIVSTQLAEK